MAGCVDKTYKCGTKKTQNYEKVLRSRTTREESIFHVGNPVPSLSSSGVCRFDEGPPWGPEPLERRTIDQAMPKKNIVCFRFPTEPIKTCAIQIYFMNFPPPPKKNFFFFLVVVKVTKKTLRKGEEGSKNIQKTKKSLRNVQIRHAWKWIWHQIK